MRNNDVTEPAWGSTGEAVYQRTYSRKKPNGEPETWMDTVTRVVNGNLGLVDTKYHEPHEKERLIQLIYQFKILPAGRHLWMSGVPGREFLMNCWHAGWTENISDHYTFTFDQLMQGGGVGANYSNYNLTRYPAVQNPVNLHVTCDPEHQDYAELVSHELLSENYGPDWTGAVTVDDSREGWATALAALINGFFYSTEPSDLVFDVSNIRHRGARIKTFGGTAAGPAPLALLLTNVANLLNKKVGDQLQTLDAMSIDHFIAECVVSGNVRRSARMAIKNWAELDVFDFIHCKEDHQSHWTTNVSVEIDKAFFQALASGDAHAKRVFRETIAAMLANGEPGFYNRALGQQGEVGDVTSCNPCGEIFMEEWEYCCLGHVNLDAFVGDDAGAREAHRLMARFLLRATFGDIPNERSQEVGNRNRRIGVGHFGFQSWIVKQGVRYSDSYRNNVVRQKLRSFYEAARQEARDYAFQLRIPEPIKVTTVAPTGTIAKMPGKPEGIHPIYAKYFVRRVRYSTVDPDQLQAVSKLVADGHHTEPDLYSRNTTVVEFLTKDSLMQEVEDLGLNADFLVESADEISLNDMLGVQAMYQAEYADNAVSFTVNVKADAQQKAHLAQQVTDGVSPMELASGPALPQTVDAAVDMLERWIPYLKGTTIMVDGSRPQAPYERISKADYDLAQYVKTVDDSYDEASCATGGSCPVK